MNIKDRPQKCEVSARGIAIMAPVSNGELFDKVTILMIKAARIRDECKLVNVRAELLVLQTIADQFEPISREVRSLINELKVVNEKLWVIEEDIRICEHKQDFGPRFIKLARAVYITNDQRMALKSQLNQILKSTYREEKSYQVPISVEIYD